VTRRLLVSYLSLVAFAVIVLAVPLGVVFARSEHRQLVDGVTRDAFVLALLVEETLEGQQAGDLPRLAADYQRRTGGRVVVVDARGVMVADSEPSAPGARNFGSRPEIVAALRGQTVTGSRYSSTLGHDLLYVAVPVASGGQVHGAVRITYPLDVVDRRIRQVWLLLAAVAAIVLVATSAVSLLLARSIARPLRQLERAAERLGRGDLTVRAELPAGPREIRTLARTVNDTAARLERLLGAQRAFVADASHQLRSPLAALRLRLENLEAQAGRAAHAPAQQDLDGAITEVRRLSRLVDGLLALARAEQQPPAPRPVDLPAVVSDRLQAWSALAHERKLRLASRTQPRLTVMASPGHLEQVLDNLLANAMDAAPGGTIITITAARAGNEVELHVIDQGPGMTAEQRARALDRFWRAPAAAGAGSGLGLAIVQQLLTADGGTIELRPADGGGLDVAIRLQAAAAADHRAGHPA
jgi:signal transduction histidine kinase